MCRSLSGGTARLTGARVDDHPDLPAVAFTSDYSRPGFERLGFLVVTRFTLWWRSNGARCHDDPRRGVVISKGAET